MAASDGRSTFVTGAYGMLGAWLVRTLLDRGERVVVLRRDRAVGSALDGVEERCHVIHGDVADEALMARVVVEEEVGTVFHLAAQTIVGAANQSPVSTYTTNIKGTWSVLEAARLGGARRVVVAASDKAYGEHAALPYTEDMALQPMFPYDVSKAATDLIARSYWHTLRAAGRHDPLCQHLRRRRPQPVTTDPGADRRRARRPRAADPLGRDAGAGLPLCRGRGRGVSGDRRRAGCRGRRRTRRGLQRRRRTAGERSRGGRHAGTRRRPSAGGRLRPDAHDARRDLAPVRVGREDRARLRMAPGGGP